MAAFAACGFEFLTEFAECDLRCGEFFLGGVAPRLRLLKERLRFIRDLLTPGLVYANGPQFARALEVFRGTDILEDFNTAAGHASSPEVEKAHGRVGPDTIAKFLFTSGSTGTPKAVINTQRMWCANQAMIASIATTGAS